MDQNDEDAKLLQKNIKQAQLAVPLDRAPGSTTLAGSLELAIAASSKSLSQEDLLSMIRMHDPLTASVVVSQALRPVSQASLRTFTERAVSQLSLGLNEEANAKQVDDLADISALVAIRGGVHISEGNFPSLHAAFRKRISTWTLSRMV